MITYSAVPPAVDFGQVPLGGDASRSFIVKYFKIADTQTTLTNEQFYIDDQGTDARQFIKLSVDGLNFFDKVNIASFAPDSFTKLYIRVAPTPDFAVRPMTYTVYVRSKLHKDFVLPVRFRIVGGRYVTPQMVRDVLGLLGKDKKEMAFIDDRFSSKEIWTDIDGTWVTQNNVMTGTSNPSAVARTITKFSSYGDQLITCEFEISSGSGGLLFSYKDALNYYAVRLNPTSSLVELIKVKGGSLSLLTSYSANIPPDTLVNLRLEVFEESVDVYLNGNLVIRWPFVEWSGFAGLYVFDGLSKFYHYHVNLVVPLFDDAIIGDYILASEAYIEKRTQKVWQTRMRTEIFDWKDQFIEQMPFIVARQFNTLPTWNWRAAVLREASLYLTYRPVLGVVSVEENEATDGSSDTWVLRKQGREGDYVVYPELGKIVFIANFPRNGHRNIRVTYSYGEPEVPPEVQRYVALLAARKLILAYGSVEGIRNIIATIDDELEKLEEFVPKWTGMFATPLGTSGQPGVGKVV